MDFNYKSKYQEEGIEKDFQNKIRYGDETYFGNYDLAQRLLKV